MKKTLFFVGMVVLGAPLSAMEDQLMASLQEQAETPSTKEGINLLMRFRTNQMVQDHDSDKLVQRTHTQSNQNNNIQSNNNSQEQIFWKAIKSYDDAGKFHCKSCSTVFDNSRLARTHNSQTKHVLGYTFNDPSSVETVSCICGDCQQVFSTKEDAMSHMGSTDHCSYSIIRK